MRSLFLMFVVALFPIAQVPEPVISKDSISIHQVKRGTMPLREIGAGFITSTDPPKATISFRLKNTDAVHTGQNASVQIKPTTVIPGRLARIESDAGAAITAEIELDEPLPESASIGLKVSGLIDIGELRDVVYFERPGDSRPDTESIIFLLEPDGEHAKRVKVRYGRQSGSLMEIIGGLSPGDRVIVTDMSAWAAHERVQLK